MVYCVCHQDDVSENSICSVYVGGYCGLSESGLSIFCKLCPADFPVVCKCSSVLLQSIVMRYGMLIVVMMGRRSDDSAR